MKKVADIPFFFVVGRPRSGTTLLRTLFDAHPNVAFPPESQFIINLYPKYGKITNWTEKIIINYYNDLIDQWLFDTWKMDLEKLKKRLLGFTGENTYGTISKVVYIEYQSLFNKGEVLFIGDKNPGYAIYTKLLLKIFPEAKFIHILRDYRDNFVSIKKVDFELPIPSLVAQKWKYFFKKFNRDSKIKPSRYLTINYEELAKSPEVRFQELCNFIGIEFDDSVFNFHNKKEEILNTYPDGYIDTYHTSLLQKINTSKIGVWKKELSDKQVKLMDQTLGKYAEMAGYQRKYSNYNLIISIAALPGRFIAAMLSLATKIVDTFPYKLRYLILNKGPLAIARIYYRLTNPKKLESLVGITTRD